MTALVGLILAGTVAEAVLLLTLWRRTARGVPPALLLPNLGAGTMLLGAVLAARLNASPLWLCACLAGAGCCHLLDLRRRWRN